MHKVNALTSGRRTAFLSLAIISVLFALVFRLEYLTPMQSDDYAYYLKGISLKAIYTHYMGWSGRLVADSLASAVLVLDNHFLITFINAIAVMAIALIITFLPLFGERKNAPFSVLTFFLIFSLYWVANPSLGQTSFWIVGSANYLWTNCVHFLFLLLFIRETKNTQSNLLKQASLFLLSLVAGCSNENTGLTTLCLISFLALREFRSGYRPYKLLLYIAGFAAGVAILLLSPGNLARTGQFADWYNLAYTEQFFIHFIKRFPNAMAQYWQPFIVLILLLKFQPKLSKETKLYTGLFTLASFTANAILMPAPHIPNRTLNGGFIYLLIAICFAAYSFLAQPQAKKQLMKALTLVCGLQFVVSYYFMYNAYRDASSQALVRENIIKTAIKMGADHIEIPKFHFGTLLRQREKFDEYFFGSTMSKYYGTTARITEYDQNSKGP